MKAILMAAGTGSRLRPLTQDVPKCLVEAEGCPLIETHLRVLASQGITAVRLVAGYLAEKLEPLGLPMTLNPRFESTNMVRSLACAREHLQGEFILAYGDIVYSPRVLRTLLDTPGDMVVAVDLDWFDYWSQRFDSPLSDAETLRIEDGRIVEIGQKPSGLEDIQAQFMGLMKFSAKGAKALSSILDQCEAAGAIGPRPFDKAYTTDLLTECIRQGHALVPAPVRGEWVEMDTVRDRDLPETSRRISDIIRALDQS